MRLLLLLARPLVCVDCSHSASQLYEQLCREAVLQVAVADALVPQLGLHVLQLAPEGQPVLQLLLLEQIQSSQLDRPQRMQLVRVALLQERQMSPSA